MGQRMKRYRVFIRNSAEDFFDAWECEAASIPALLASGVIRERLGDQPYDELIVTEIR